MNITQENNVLIERELQWLQAIIEQQLGTFLRCIEQGYREQDINPAIPDITEADTCYAKFIRMHALTPDERKVVLLALAQDIQPELLDHFLICNESYHKIYTEFGGVTGHSFNGFMPTIKTALFVLAGHRPALQLMYTGLFDKTGKLYASGILKDGNPEEDVPLFHRRLALSESTLNYLLTGSDIQHELSPFFPARRLTTRMEWEDLILPESTSLNLKELLTWSVHGRKLTSELEMEKNIQPGYRAFFHGPSGTGKTLAAALVGKKVNKPVYRIDLSQLVSKYIGETEKNLEKIFTVAEKRDWILFFDEADALFGKRTGISSSHDRFANQETAYLLQRIEACDNLVILATNLKANIDEAFARRFQSVIHFSLPGVEERLQLWRGAFSRKLGCAADINLEELARKYDIAGGAIVNIVRYATLMAVASGLDRVIFQDLLEGIQREYTKLGRTL